LLFPRKSKAKTDVFSVKDRTVTVYTSANRPTTDKTNTNLQFKDLKQPLETQVCVLSSENVSDLFGIGGAITDASYCFAKLTKENQQEFYAYYDKEKELLSIIRTIHSSDFSSGSYTYIEEGDAALKRSIFYDKEFRIPLIKKAIGQQAEKQLIC
jgi:glucosylceramidase